MPLSHLKNTVGTEHCFDIGYALTIEPDRALPNQPASLAFAGCKSRFNNQVHKRQGAV